MADLSLEIDPTGEAVEEWMDDNIPPFDGLVPFTTADQKGIATHRFDVDPGQEDLVARHVAIGIMGRRLAQRPSAFASWHDTLTAGAGLGNHETLVQSHAGQLVGTRDDPRVLKDLYGMVAEHILWRVLQAVDRGLGLPVHIEGHDWDVTDHGGDSVAVYQTDTGFAFRLWESKAVTGAAAMPKAAVGKATTQLTRKGWEYLARWVTVGRRLPDQDLAEFFVEMPDMWKAGDGRAGAGVAISTHATKPTGTCFTGLAGQFDLPDENKLGNLLLTVDFKAFAKLVRADIWKGAGWNAP